MNGQLNGFHDAFIEEGTFLFTSESVGEGHSGEATGPGAKRERVVGTGLAWLNPQSATPTTLVALARRAVRRAAAARFLVAPPVPSACTPLPSPRFLSTLFLVPGRALRHGEDSRKREGRGAAAARALPGEGTISSCSPSEWRTVGVPPGARAPGPRERASRIAAATTCLPPVAAGSGERLGCLRARPSLRTLSLP